MRRCKCGVEAPAFKTCRRREGEGTGVLYDSCWLPLADRLWIVPGPVACFGRCRGCGEWFSVRELTDRKPGGGHGAMVETCTMCVG